MTGSGSALGRETHGPTVGHSNPYRIKFDEAGPDGLVRASTLLAFAQDVAWVHSEGLGFDRAWYAARQLTWLVRAVDLELEQAAPSGDVLTVTTRVTGYRRVSARRRTTFVDASGERVAWADTDWAIVDARGQPTRVPAEFAAFTSEPPGRFEPIRVPIPTTPAAVIPVRLPIRPADLDPLGHVNNAVHIDYLEAAIAGLPEGRALLNRLPRRYRVEYLAPAPPDASLRVATWAHGGSEPRLDRAGSAREIAVAYRLTTGAGIDLTRAIVRA